MRRALAGIAAALVVAAFPQVAAAVIVWTLLATPLTVTAGQATTFTMTATDTAGPEELGCLEVTLPASFTIQSVSDPQASNNRDWAATVAGTTIEVRSLSGGGRLHILQSVTFQVTAIPSTAGATSWPNHAHRHEDCSGANEVGLPVQVVVLPALLPSPTPSPTPRATPRPTPKPTAAPTLRPSPIPSLPVSLPPLATPRPPASSSPSSAPTAHPSHPAGASPSAGGSTAPTPASSSPSSAAVPGGVTTSPSPAAGGGASANPAPQVRPERVPIEVGGGTLTLLDGFDTWSVPAAVVGVPGLLVVLWVALQTVGALAWIPAVRRLRGDEDDRRARSTR